VPRNPLRTALLLVLAAACVRAVPSRAADASDDAVGSFAAQAHELAAAEKKKKPQPVAEPEVRPLLVNLRDQFEDYFSDRDQQDIGSCHAFGSVAAIEAAYFRKYAKHIVLAEEDLFLRKTILGGDAYAQFCVNGCALKATSRDKTSITPWRTAC
jgi:hypothetical protein